MPLRNELNGSSCRAFAMPGDAGMIFTYRRSDVRKMGISSKMTRKKGIKMRSGRWTLVVIAATAVFVSYTFSAGRSPSGQESEIRLPDPKTSGGMPLTETLAKRRSQKTFASKPLSMEQVSQLCWAAQGITDKESGFRTAPSAMALYVIHVFVVDDTGAHEYVPQPHALRGLGVDNALDRLRTAAGQAPVKSAPLSMVLAMEPARLEAKCGKNAERYALIESGHVAQNVLLQATAMGLVSVPVGGIDESKVAEALHLPKCVRPVYVLPLGYPDKK